jgi:hypothetical protein
MGGLSHNLIGQRITIASVTQVMVLPYPGYDYVLVLGTGDD